MMMLIRSSCKLFNNVSRVHGSLSSYSTEALVNPFAALEDQILRNGGDPRNPVAPILNQWVQQGGDVTQNQLQQLISRLSSNRRFTHALEVSEWMSNERKYSLTPGGFAKHINLISKVHGLKQAENFFRSIPDDKVGFKVYAALLRCYGEHKSLEKAEAVMKKIKKYHPFYMTASYNMMLKLYAQLGRYEKLDRLMQEMIAKDICNAATFTIRLDAYLAAADIEGMEMLLMRMEADPLATVDWLTYIVAANGYIKAGNFEKALATLKKSEKLVRGKKVRHANESLQTMYAAIGNKDEVYRIWNTWKTMKICRNSSYISMLNSLVKLGDIAGAEKILEEWESEYKIFDTRIPNLMIIAYCKCGMLDKAEACIKRLLDSGKQLHGSSWAHLASVYVMDNDMEKAVQAMKKAIANQPRYRLDSTILAACLDYLKEKDLESALEILQLCREGGFISIGTCDRLVSYVRDEIPETKVLDLIKEDYQLQLDEGTQLVDVERTDCEA